MNPLSDDGTPAEGTLGDGGQSATYTLEIISEITGVSPPTILLYQEHGLVRPLAGAADFDDEAVHTLRQIEHLRLTCEANLDGLRLILDLMDQVEHLRIALRSHR